MNQAKHEQEVVTLQASRLSFSHGVRTVLTEIEFSLRQGEIVALLGANGAGKSTLFRLFLGLIRPKGGVVCLQGRNIATWSARDIARRIAYVPQGHTAVFPYTVREVAMLGRIAETRLILPPNAQDRAVVDQILGRMGLLHLADQPYTEISGGERQLTLIARALAQGARLLILDEPTSSLDFGNQVRLLKHLRGLAAEGHGILFSTHLPEQAARTATRIAVLHQGRIMVDGAPNEVMTSKLIGTIYNLRLVSRETGDEWEPVDDAL
ncbi:MAG: ABC transporter ATP-binding protein [Corticimicrobacter sp.]|uniref:ABC transporter ATP-binding protein n=1 Tax=Corticimicrobacter sp. TaxID=2678536 RepID=UPI0032DAD3BA